MCESQDWWYIHDLFDIPNNPIPIKFQLNQTRTQRFQKKIV